jgi:hypothetical protein
MCFNIQLGATAPDTTVAYKLVRRWGRRRYSQYGYPATGYKCEFYPVGAVVRANKYAPHSRPERGYLKALAGIYVFLTLAEARRYLKRCHVGADADAEFEIIEVRVSPKDFLYRSASYDLSYHDNAATYRKVRVLRVVR